MKPAELRRWMIESTKVLENLLRMADGKRVQLHGPTGKTYWAETTPQMMAWAMERVLRKCVPDLSGITLSGDADAPIVTQHLDTPLGRDKELARRLALLQRVIDVPEESHDVPADGRPLGKGNGGSGTQRVLEAPAESSNGQCSPAVGEATVVDKARGISVVRVSHDGRSDGGGDWDVQQHGKQVTLLRGITAEGAAQVVQAMDAEGAFDAA